MNTNVIFPIARDSASGSAGTPSGSEDNQSDTETVVRSHNQQQPTSIIKENESDEHDEQQGKAGLIDIYTNATLCKNVPNQNFLVQIIQI